jgi:phenylalanyl-tRNA synthetase beta chain
MQSYLSRLGFRPINNIVDISNYIMLLTGQPLHIYDYDKVLALDSGAQHATLAARYPKKDEKLKLINGKEVVPVEGTVMISTDSTAIGLAGVMGGGDTEVDANTKNIIIECATFDMYAIRRSSMAHGVFSDAVARYNKGQSPMQNDSVLSKTMSLISELAGGVVASPILDDHHIPAAKTVNVTARFINERLGSNLDSGQMIQILRNVEFAVGTEGEDLIIKPPFWRTDIAIAEDIVEEVGRLYGYENIPMKLPNKTLQPASKDGLYELKKDIRSILSAAGANEVLTYNFVHGNLIDRTNQNREAAYQLNNALSPDLQYYRLSLTPSLLEKVRPNIKNGYDSFALFEMNKCHIKDWLDDERLPKEENRLGLVYASDDVSGKGNQGPAYYIGMKYLQELMDKLEIGVSFGAVPDKSQLEPNKQMLAPFASERAAIVMEVKSGELLGIIGEVKPSIREVLKLPEHTVGFELDMAKLFKFWHSAFDYRPLPKYPKVEQDVTVQVDVDLTFDNLLKSFSEEVNKLLLKPALLNVDLVDIYQSKVDKAHKNVTFHVEMASYESTLKATDVNTMLDTAVDGLKQRFSAQRI